MHNVVSDVVDGEQERVLYRSSLLNARALIFTRAYLWKKGYVIKRPTRKLPFQAISISTLISGMPTGDALQLAPELAC